MLTANKAAVASDDMIILDQAVLDDVRQRLRPLITHGADDDFSARLEAQQADQDARSRTVWLHVYDLNTTLKYLLNNYMFSRFAGLGAFHCGVEVLGAEWSFQADPWRQDQGADMTGLMCLAPKRHPVHIYRESVLLGQSSLSVCDIWEVLLRLERRWPATSYHAVHRNCTDFAEEFVRAMSVTEPFPEWVRGIAKGYLIHTPFADMSAPSSEMPRSYMSLGHTSLENEKMGTPAQASTRPDFDGLGPADEEWSADEEPRPEDEDMLRDEGLRPSSSSLISSPRSPRKPDREETFMGELLSCVMRNKGDEEPIIADLCDDFGVFLPCDSVDIEHASPCRPCSEIAALPETPVPDLLPLPPPPEGCQQGCFHFVCILFQQPRWRAIAP